MELEVGTILTGKVTGITKFGAFVALAPGKSGLVHISEIANTYVNDIREHLTEGQEVNVKIVSIDDNGRINLSIKATLPPPPPREKRPPMPPRDRQTAPRPAAPARQPANNVSYMPPPPPPQPVSSDASFEDKLKRFMQDSDSKMAGMRQYADKRSSRRRGR